MSRQMILAAAVAVLGLGAWYVTTPSSSSSSARVSAQNEALLGAANAQETGDIDISTIKDMQIGNPDAPVTVIEYASYTCPHCANFHAGTYKQLKADYIDTGKINFVYREVYFDRYGLWASAVARCADTPTSFFGISDLIYSTQAEWSRAGEPAAIVEELRKIGRLAGLGNEQLEACLTDQDKLRTLVAWYQHNAEADGISSTPSFVINGKKYQNMAYPDMVEIIEEASGS
ncbi:MAG: DsbA family protein [Aliishimia sp.]